MFEEQAHPSPDFQGGLPEGEKSPARSLGEVEADHQKFLQQSAQIAQAKSVDATSDRRGQIELFLMENELFGIEPYAPEVMTQLTDLLFEKEADKRLRDPDFKIDRNWKPSSVQRYLERKYTTGEEVAEATTDERARDTYESVVDGIRAANPDISNLALSRQLLSEHSEFVPTEHLVRLQAFVDMHALASSLEDQAIVASKINAQDFSGGIPNPTLFIETEILTDENLSEAYRDEVAKRFNIPNPRIRTGGQVDDTLDSRAPDGGPLYTPDNPIRVGDADAYENPDGSRAIRVTVPGRGDREIPWLPDDKPDVIGTKISLAKLWAVNEWKGQTDFFGETIDIETHILSQTDPQKLAKVKDVMNALLGGTRGFDAIILQDNEAEFIGWLNQFTATKGDAAESDFDADAAITNRTNLGFHPDGDPQQLDIDILRAAALYAKSQYGSGEPDYFGLQRHLHGLFPHKVSLSGENAEDTF